MHQYEADIRNGLARLLDYLENRGSDSLKMDFLETGPRVLSAIEALFDALTIDLVTIRNLLTIFKEKDRVRHFEQIVG